MKPHIIYKDGAYWVFLRKDLGRDFFKIGIRTYFSRGKTLKEMWQKWQQSVRPFI